MFSQFKPINDGVLVKLFVPTNTTEGGIIIPLESMEKTQIAYVVNPGNSKQLQVGDKIYYKKYLGHQLNEEYMVLREEDILGIMGE